MRARPFLIVLAVVVAANVALVVVGALLPSPSGPDSSSYATAPRGLAAAAELLARDGHPVRRVRELPGDARFVRGSTVVLLGPEVLLGQEARALRRHAQAGGRVVVGGADPEAWVDNLLGRRASWHEEASRVYSPEVPIGELAGVRQVWSAGEGAFGSAGGAVRALGGPGDSLLLVAPVGRGRIYLLADPSPLQNRFLAAGDNAALALALAGPRDRPVEFVESVHGYGTARGLGALPGGWRWALAGLGLAALLFLLARGRRLGPPDPEPPAAVPPRREYVEAMAGVLERTGDPTAAEPVRRAAHDRLTERFRLAPDAPAEEIRRAGARAGLDEDEARALAGPPGSDAEALAAGRALARLEGSTKP